MKYPSADDMARALVDLIGGCDVSDILALHPDIEHNRAVDLYDMCQDLLDGGVVPTAEREREE